MQCVDGQPELDPACDAALQTYNECGPYDCSSSVTSNGDCSATCNGAAAFEVSCTPTSTADPALSCTCTSGPKTGGGYTVIGSCPDTEWLKAAPNYCDAD